MTFIEKTKLLFIDYFIVTFCVMKFCVMKHRLYSYYL